MALASGEGKYVEMVRQAQLSINLPNVKCVDAKGLRLEADHLHLTTMSQVRVGLMLARAFLHISHNHNAYHSASIANSTSFIET